MFIIQNIILRSKQMKQQTATLKVNTMCMCMCMMCCCAKSGPRFREFGNAEAVDMPARCLP